MRREGTATRPLAEPRRLRHWLRANVELVVIAAILVALAGYIAVLAGYPGTWLG